ncbi:Tryprostatin B 6-hydroxylase [Apiospora phragmitis]|uniref:Tryprostatin B 6-hydroxylase n=1 Tax=Apiospora phragmitis TaxID=2905665 RepID=A0ABR1VE15_9PEZI
MALEVIYYDLAFPAFILLTVLSLLRFALYPVLLSPLARIPKAHWSCAVSPIWILWARYTSRENRTIGEAHRRYGPIVRLAPNEISINDMESVKTVYQGGFDKHQWYSVFNNYGVPNMFSSIYAKHHGARKRMISHVYSKSYIHSSASVAAQADVILNARVLSALEEASHGRQAHQGIDVHSFFSAVAMDFITAYSFGRRNSPSFIQQKAYREHWLGLYRARKGYSFFSQELPLLSRLSSFIGLHLTPVRVDAANRELEEWCGKLCAATLSSLETRDDESQTLADDAVVIRALLHGLDKEERVRGKESPIFNTAIFQRHLTISSEIFDHLLAGQETTGVTLTYLSWHLSQSQDLQRQLRAELLSLTPNMSMGGGKVIIPNSGQLNRLPLLHAVIVETIRLYAPAGGPEPRITPDPSCRIGPYEIPGGMRISASAYNLHRDEKYFPHAGTWDHTRWRRDDMDEQRHKEINRQFWGFSSGGRMCLGSNFAMHEMKLLVAAIYTNYTSHIVNDEGIEPTDGYTSHPTSGQLWLRFERIQPVKQQPLLDAALSETSGDLGK